MCPYVSIRITLPLTPSHEGRGKFMKFPLPLGERVRVRGR